MVSGIVDIVVVLAVLVVLGSMEVDVVVYVVVVVVGVIVVCVVIPVWKLPFPLLLLFDLGVVDVSLVVVPLFDIVV